MTAPCNDATQTPVQSFNLRDKYKDHIEEGNLTLRFYMGENEKSGRGEKEIPREEWEV